MAHTKLLSIYSQTRENRRCNRSSSPFAAGRSAAAAAAARRKEKLSLQILFGNQFERIVSSARLSRASSPISSPNTSLQSSSSTPRTSGAREQEIDDPDDLELVARSMANRSSLSELQESNLVSGSQMSNIEYFILNRQHRRSSIRLLPYQNNRSIYYYGNFRPNHISTPSSSSSTASSSGATTHSTAGTSDSSARTSGYVPSPRIYLESVNSVVSGTGSSSSSSADLSSMDFDELLHSDEEGMLMYNRRSANSMCDSKKSSRNISHFLNARSYGNHIVQRAKISNEFGLNHLLRNNILKERTFDLEQMNKVFCSQWLNDRQVIFGTKCNNLIVLDVNNGKKFHIPTLESRSFGETNANGMHFIEMNPSRTFLATGASNANDIAIYRLPTMEPYCILEASNLESAHTDLIFDVCWIDDEHLVSGSRDSYLALWHVEDHESELNEHTGMPVVRFFKPNFVQNSHMINRIRSLSFNERHMQVAALSLSAQLHIFDAVTFKSKLYCGLAFDLENVCLAEEPNMHLYAIGSKGHVQLVDNRNLISQSVITSVQHDCGIRSLSFNDYILTIGTGVGALNFYDIRNEKYFAGDRSQNIITLKTSKGWMNSSHANNQMQNLFVNIEYSPAIYTHKYDQSRTRIFTAGGPLPASLYGNYAGLWS